MSSRSDSEPTPARAMFFATWQMEHCLGLNMKFAHLDVSTECSTLMNAYIMHRPVTYLCCIPTGHASYQDLCCIQPAPCMAHSQGCCNLDQDLHEVPQMRTQACSAPAWTSTPHTRSCLSYTFASFSVSSSLLMLKSRSAQVDPLQLELALVLCLLQLANSIMFYTPARFQLLNKPQCHCLSTYKWSEAEHDMQSMQTV